MKKIEIVKGLVHHKGKFLMLRKLNDMLKENNGKWEVPGGKIKPGETPNMAMRREVVEETGIPCKIKKEIAVIKEEREGIDSTAHIFLLEPNNLDVKLSKEHDYHMWATNLEIKKLPLVLFADLLLEYFDKIESGEY